MSMEQENITESKNTMADFKEEIDRSFTKLKEGDFVTGKVIGISDSEVTVDLGTYAEGIIKTAELSNDPKFSAKEDLKEGESLTVMVLGEDEEGALLLSKRQADDVLAWDNLKELMDKKTIVTVKIAASVKAGVVAYLNGIRAFIPASQLSLSYVENLDEWVGKTVDAVVITVDKNASKLVLSSKEVERKRADEDRSSRIANLQKGLVTKGTVETIMPYGAFVNIGDGLSGLVHISQICGRHIKSPNEVVKEGEEVTVKIIDIKDGKISLSMKAVEAKEDVVDDVKRAPFEYKSGGEASTGLASLLKDIKL